MAVKDLHSVDLVGFLDGMRARNLSTIERSTALQVSELQIRLHLLQNAVQSDSTLSRLNDELAGLTSALRDPGRTIVQRLSDVGTRLRDLLLLHGDQLKARPVARENIEWAIRRFIEAAELAHHDGVTDIAISLGTTWQSIRA